MPDGPERLRDASFRTVAAGVISVLLLSACGSSASGHPIAADDVATTDISATDPATTTPTDTRPTADTRDSGVDPTLLDTGDYPTTARPDFGMVRDITEGREVAGWRLAEALVFPHQVDNKLRALVIGTGMMYTDGGLSLTAAMDGPAASAAKVDLVAAATTTRVVSNADGNPQVGVRDLAITLLQYPDAATAERAAQEIHAAGRTTIGSSEQSIGGLPDTLVHSAVTTDGSLTSAAAVTPHGRFVLHARASTTPDRQSAIAPAITRLVDLQLPLLDRFEPIEKADLARLPIDEDQLLTLTLPGAETGARGTRTVHGPRGYLHEQDDVDTLDLLERTGTDRVATDASTVFRAEDAEAAAELATLLREHALDAGAADIPSPPNLPDTFCFALPGPAMPYYTCLVQRGRFVGEVNRFEGLADVHRAISAQYLILGSAQ
ncbi:DUF7373 family lipoprotein [Millisia brevis]|uniref:DUF7373 family lipoprotein n=1 Tax=Millisia brevis TaxID=264148 RepID=UPI0008317B88|nr:hypothetical protein [Millisia brevis]